MQPWWAKIYEKLEQSSTAVQFVTYTSNIVWWLLIKSPAKWCFIYTPKPLFTFIWHLMRINFGPRSQVFIPRVRQIYERLSVPGPLSFHPSPSIPPSLTENLYTELRSHSAKYQDEKASDSERLLEYAVQELIHQLFTTRAEHSELGYQSFLLV